ncbi:AtpZ/AtpI family protein [Aquimarina hainanensis]|uniref:AtpZ/AtpI family protein n=1 Tax=Aquimarina hainanensis TaxID=1578017 RepID=A0ABW5N5V8_9FLAO|nr:AtpZ/AtpI family protein [Aquimarina sp. TRL1]QKX04730.1 AtpZ/AtpI family protein [Aquimarina sp. TRL1]
MDKNNKGNQLKSFARYTTIGIQMLAIIIGGYYLGGYLDERAANQEPVYQKWVGLAAVFLAIGSVLWQVIKESNRK